MNDVSTLDAPSPQTAEYWDSYYAQRNSPTFPSQFCLFVLGESRRDDMVVELGCGQGRDSLYFAQQGLRTLGVDASDTAIGNCREQARNRGLAQADFLCSTIESDSLQAQLQARRALHPGRVLVYSRFFLHAIDQAAETRLLQIARSLMRPGEVMALEFRTRRDEMLRKSTPSHYRRYIDPMSTIRALSTQGFDVRYFVEGFGFAKYKDDDAHVCRILAVRQ